MPIKKILVAELEVQTQDIQLEEVDVHEWDIYTKDLTRAAFDRMFYSGEGDIKSFTLAPHPTLKDTTGYVQEELERQGWCSGGINYFQLGGLRFHQKTQSSAVVPPNQYGTVNTPGKRKVGGGGEYNNAYFIGRADDDAGDENPDYLNNQSFWAEQVIMNAMETDLALSRDHWTEVSKRRIEDELTFLSWGDCKVNFSRNKDSLDEELTNAGVTPSTDRYCLLLVMVVVNSHTGIKNNHLNVHFSIKE